MQTPAPKAALLAALALALAALAASCAGDPEPRGPAAQIAGRSALPPPPSGAPTPPPLTPSADEGAPLATPLSASQFTPSTCALPAGDRFSDYPAPPTSGAVRLVILHTNDLHGQVYPQKALWLRKGDAPLAGGLSALAARIGKERLAARASGAAVLLLDAGDVFQGTPEGDRTEGRVMLDWMALAGYDAITLGEHDFDHGAETVEAIFARARFPVLVANLVRETPREPAPFVRAALDRVLAGGLRVTVIGVMPSELKLTASPRATRGYDWDDSVEAVRLEARNARERGAEVVVVLSHCGAALDEKIARSVEGVAAVIGGRTHQGIDPAIVLPETNAVVAATFSKGSTLGRVELVYDRAEGRVVTAAGRVLDVFAGDDPPDAATDALVAKEAAAIHEAMSVTLGAADDDVLRERGAASSPLGDWLADLMRAATGAEVALHNKAGIRADIARGPIRLTDVYQVSPFAGSIVRVTLTGRDLREALEHALSDPGRFGVEVSGLEARYDLDRPPGDRLIRVRIGAAPLDLDRRYTVALNGFLAKGGDGFASLARGEDARPSGKELMDLHAEDVRRRGRVGPLLERRLAPAETTAPGVMPGG